MPADYQVARPVAAPNYVQMYSEGIRGALEPMNYLLNMQKELSEEDLRKGQIQNFLDEHQDKANQLAETTRSNKATEAMTALERQLEQQRVTETGRHDMVEESEIGRHNVTDEALRKQQLDEIERQNQFDQMKFQKDLELRTEAQEHDLKHTDAQTDELLSQARQQKQEFDNQQNDSKVIDDFNSKLSKFTPEQIWNSSENPEVQSTIDAAISGIKTGTGRQRLDEIIGPKTALGREISERKELNGMSTEAKNAFHNSILKSPSTDENGNPIPSQIRFEQSLSQARQVQARYEQRQNWTDVGQQAYKQALIDGKSDEEAYGIGRGAEIKAQTQDKARLDQKPNPAMVQQLTDLIAPSIPKKPGEDDKVYQQRAQTEAGMKAAQYEEDQRLNPQKFREETQSLIQPSATSTSAGNASDFVRSTLTPSVAKPGSGNVQPSTSPTPPPGPTIEPNAVRGKPLSMVSPNSGTSALLPPETPQYAAASNSLSAQMRSIFGAPLEPDESDSGTMQTSAVT